MGRITMKRDEEEAYVCMRVEDMPVPLIPADKKICSICGKEVWADKRTERIWSKIRVVCMNCIGKEIPEADEDIKIVILPESIETIDEFIQVQKMKNRNQ